LLCHSSTAFLFYYRIKVERLQDLVMKSSLMLTMKSKQSLDEIFFADEIKSVPNLTRSYFITQVISSIEDGFIPSERTELVEKEHRLTSKF